MHWKRFSYLKLLIVGTGTLACHMISYYFLISHDIHISVLYAPSVLRGFSYAILSATFMVCLEEIMSFRHFFQALSIFNMLHMVVGQTSSETHAGMEKHQGRDSVDIRETRTFHSLIIKIFRKKILFYLILYLNLRRKIPQKGFYDIINNLLIFLQNG